MGNLPKMMVLVLEGSRAPMDPLQRGLGPSREAGCGALHPPRSDELLLESRIPQEERLGL